jgi:hypothetical protein
MLKEREIRDQVAGYLAGYIPLQDLSSWIYSVTWDMDADNPRTRALAYAVLGQLAEYSSAGLSEQDLWDALDSLSRIIVTQLGEDHPVQMASSAQLFENRLPLVSL